LKKTRQYERIIEQAYIGVRKIQNIYDDINQTQTFSTLESVKMSTLYLIEKMIEQYYKTCLDDKRDAFDLFYSIETLNKEIIGSDDRLSRW